MSYKYEILIDVKQIFYNYHEGHTSSEVSTSWSHIQGFSSLLQVVWQQLQGMGMLKVITTMDTAIITRDNISIDLSRA